MRRSAERTLRSAPSKVSFEQGGPPHRPYGVPPSVRPPARFAVPQPTMIPDIRPYRPGDDLAAITDLIHRAYAVHLQHGLRYWGTHQPVSDTEKRLRAGVGLVMLWQGEYIGTVTVRPPQPESSVALYRDPTVYSLSQFCVAPRFKGQGLGRRLHDHALAVAREGGARTIALDTAQPASALIRLYQGWGYEVVGECDWRPQTNYVSALMARPVDIATMC